MKYFKPALFVVLAVLLSGCHIGPRENRACYKEQCYKLELAMTEEQKARGLQHRDQLGKDQGMLFFMKPDVAPKFWMRETLIPLDMIWMDDMGKISYIEHAAVPCEKDPCPTYGPNFPAGYVLEINGGEASRLDMHLGERIVLELKNVK
ncbi:MAG: DUF192 domain-containing protein [Candidatus Omnitrophica bacterium]|nr:DUF192 domain-containing protein [Candidatus Omnitrophota bacterium]